MDALQFGGARRQKEHVAHAEQVFGTGTVEDGARIHLGGHLEGNPCREVRLDKAGEHVHRWPLGGEHDVHARCSGHLGEAGDGGFHILGGDHHQVGQLVDNNDDEGEFLLRNLVVGGKRLDPFLLEQTVAPLHLPHGPEQGP